MFNFAKAAPLVFILSACSAVGDKDEFSCPNPESGVCLDAVSAYEAAERGEKINKNNTENKTSNSESSDATLNDYSRYAPVVSPMSKPINQPKPLLEPATVLKVWINTWEDEDEILYMPSTAYKEITPRKWSVGATSENTFKEIAPFKINANSID